MNNRKTIQLYRGWRWDYVKVIEMCMGKVKIKLKTTTAIIIIIKIDSYILYFYLNKLI